MKKKITLLFVSVLFLQTMVIAQQAVRHTFELNWQGDQKLTFEGAGSWPNHPQLPVYSYRFPLPGPATLQMHVAISAVESITIEDAGLVEIIPVSMVFGTSTEQERGDWYGRLWLVPLMRDKNEVQKILRGNITIQVELLSVAGGERSGPEFKPSSVLANGTIHKISVDKPGVYKVDHAFIKDKLKLDPAQIDPSRIGVFGNGGGRIPQRNATLRIDDLEQTATWGVGLDDGAFNTGDYLLWYAEGPDKWYYDTLTGNYNMDKNIYDELNHYYIIINGPVRKSMGTRGNTALGDYVSETSRVYQRLEDEKVNLLGRFRPPGSGQEWYGDEMAVVKQLDYTNRFTFTDLVHTDSVNFKVRFAVRSSELTRFYVQFDQKEVNRTIGSVALGNYEADFANDAILQGDFIPGSPLQQLRVRFPDANGINSRAWVDYIQLNHWNKNIYRPGKPVYVRDPRALYTGIPTYSIEGLPAGGIIWDITDPLLPVQQQFSHGTKSTFSIAASGKIPMEYIAFDPALDVLTPMYTGEVKNQNLHSIQGADLLIVYYDEFESAAQTLAAHRRDFSLLDVVALPVSQVFEEFGGGSRDPSAIRDLARMIYTRDPGFRYLLLMGDATYDYLNRVKELPYHNFIPAFETEESLDPIRSFPSDDYFALLDDNEGQNLIGAIDIAVGRLPVATLAEANALVQKIIHYDRNPVTLQDWRLRAVMVADDEDGNTHINQAEGLAVRKALDHPVMNIQKIYLDAYPQETTPGGDRYPAVNEALDLAINKGALTVTYMGHGGQNGWTQERVLGINQCQSYANLNNMPLFITATCSFAGYDEPSFKTAGEHLLTNPDGGAIGLMTTVRAVYSGSNERLTRAVLNRIYKEDAPGEHASIAEILRRAKNDNALDTLDNNARKFTLLGDPSMKLAIPRYDIAVTEIKGQAVDVNMPDTIRALEKASFAGIIQNDQGQILTSFNGKLFVTVFDKVQVRKTLANDPTSSVRTFVTQTRQLFKGIASVVNGHWYVEFVLPKDIDFSYGAGKLSLYAHDGNTDASGYFDGFLIGGVSEEGLADDQPPVVELYMNNNQFVSGGMTDRNPDIYIVLSDDNGINVSGTSVGHDIEAILDNDDRNSLILNDFYQAFLDDYTGGEVRYPLRNLTPGRHTLKVQAWDLANNPGEAYLEFVVVDQDGPILDLLPNYPNPFSDFTHFQFEHNRPNTLMDVQIEVFTVSGQRVRTMEEKGFVSGGYRVADLRWNGESDTGSPLGSGIYIFKVKAVYYTAGGTTESAESQAEKLVIIR